MTNNNHPITPPPELVQEWLNTPRHTHAPKDGTFVVQKRHSLSNSEVMALAAQAAHWGADQELEACCSWVSQFNYDDYSYQERLRAARRRPKPPSLKEEALAELELLRGDANTHGLGFDAPAIRRALESLPDNQ